MRRNAASRPATDGHARVNPEDVGYTKVSLLRARCAPKRRASLAKYWSDVSICGEITCNFICVKVFTTRGGRVEEQSEHVQKAVNLLYDFRPRDHRAIYYSTFLHLLNIYIVLFWALNIMYNTYSRRTYMAGAHRE